MPLNVMTATPTATICNECGEPIERFVESVHKGWTVHPSCAERGQILDAIEAYEKRYDRKFVLE